MEFVEGDDLHSKANIEKMSNGRGLDDQDRQPWLERIRQKIVEQCSQQSEEIGRKHCGIIVTCSALKKHYRNILRGRLKLSGDMNQYDGPLGLQGSEKSAISPDTYFVYIKGDKELILQRLKERKGHYMKSDMLDGQFDDLESPKGEGDVVAIEAGDSTKSQIDRVKKKITELAGEWFLGK